MAKSEYSLSCLGRRGEFDQRLFFIEERQL